MYFHPVSVMNCSVAELSAGGAVVKQVEFILLFNGPKVSGFIYYMTSE